MLIKVLSSNFGSGEAVHLMDISEGRHFCLNCHKLIREGQGFLMSHSPTPFRRVK